MDSQKYRKFLEQQAQKNPVKVEGTIEGNRYSILWDRGDEKPSQSSSSDILDSFYLGKDMRETVVVDRRVAALLQNRLQGLEEENTRMRRRIKMLKLTLGGLVVAAVCLGLALVFVVYFPYIRIML